MLPRRVIVADIFMIVLGLMVRAARRTRLVVHMAHADLLF